MCMCLARKGWEVLGVSVWQDWVWALPILEEHGEWDMCLCFGCGGVGGVGGEWVGGLAQGLGGWGGVISVLMAGPGMDDSSQLCFQIVCC